MRCGKASMAMNSVASFATRGRGGTYTATVSLREVAATVARMVAEDRLEIVAGRILSARNAGEGLEVEFRRRGAAEPQRASFAYAFNCTGPLHSIERSKDPLLRSLLDAGQVKPDHLGIGLDIGGTCRGRRASMGDGATDQGPLLGDYRRAGHSRAGRGGGRRHRAGDRCMRRRSGRRRPRRSRAVVRRSR